MPWSGSSSTTEFGPEKGDARPTIVFLHGARMSRAAWAAQLAALGEEFHCLAPDLPGHGRAAATPFTLEGAATGVIELVRREADGGRAVLVGLSLGGYVAMAVAARAPEVVAGLVISGATAEPTGLRSFAYRGLASVFERTPSRLLLAVNRWFFRRRFPASIADAILAEGFAFAEGAVALRALVGEQFRPRLAAWTGPTLILNGEWDLFFRPGERSFAAAAVDVRRVTLRRATHLANLDQPEAFTDATRRFARSVFGPGAAPEARAQGVSSTSP